MGYYTQHTLRVIGVSEQRALEIIGLLREQNDSARYAIRADGTTEEEQKWYDCQADLSKFSEAYPGILFEMEMWGEEKGDISKMYVKDGKSYIASAQIVFPAFTESLFA